MAEPDDFLSALEIPAEFWEQMQAEVSRLAPEEACGLLGGVAGQVLGCFPVENELHSPVRFYMKPLQMLAALEAIEAHGWELLAIYHSHPAGPETPSPTDIAEFYYPESAVLIWSRPAGDWRCRGFRILEGLVYDLELTKT